MTPGYGSLLQSSAYPASDTLRVSMLRFSINDQFPMFAARERTHGAILPYRNHEQAH
jgi:hypothetical protein